MANGSGHAPNVGSPSGRAGICGALVLLLAGSTACGSKIGFDREPAAVGGPSVMRRLTESQYRATIADIFGPDIPVVARFERGLREEGLVAIGTGKSGISPFSVEQYDAAAIGISAAVVSEEHRDKLVPCKPQSGVANFDAHCARQVVEHYGLPLFRRPLRPEEVTRFVQAARAGHERLGDFYRGLQFSLAGMLMSPEFLLRVERTQPEGRDADRLQLDAWSQATRLSYFLTNSTPDRELLRAAGAGELDTKRGRERQVDRLVASPRFQESVRAFFTDMLHFDKFNDLAKDPVVYPAFNASVAADAQEQTVRTITDLLIEQKGDYRDLFTTREAYLTRALGIVYRLPVPTRRGWEVTRFPESSHRVGIQSHVAFLALHSHPGRSSPTLRGKAAREIFLCQEVPDPPPNVDFTVVQDPSNTAMPTARDRLVAHQKQPACAGCHKLTDPLGLTLENFDGLGTYRTRENSTQIDSSGALDGTDFTTPEGFAQALRNHPETPRCLVEKMYRFAVGRDTEMEERAYMDYLLNGFKKNGYRVPDLMRSIALSENFFAVSASEDTSHEDQLAMTGERS